MQDGAHIAATTTAFVAAHGARFVSQAHATAGGSSWQQGTAEALAFSVAAQPDLTYEQLRQSAPCAARPARSLAGDAPLPESVKALFIIGAQKAGTTWLARVAAQHDAFIWPWFTGYDGSTCVMRAAYSCSSPACKLASAKTRAANVPQAQQAARLCADCAELHAKGSCSVRTKSCHACSSPFTTHALHATLATRQCLCRNSARSRKTKEMDMFNTWPLPPVKDWRESFDLHTRTPGPDKVLLDSTPAYLHDAVAPAAIQALVPHARFVVILRVRALLQVITVVASLQQMVGRVS